MRNNAYNTKFPIVYWNGDREYNHEVYLTEKDLAAIDWGRYLPWTAAGEILSEHLGVPVDRIVVGCRLEMIMSALAAIAKNYWNTPDVGLLSPSFAVVFDRLADVFQLPITRSFIPSDMEIDIAKLLRDFSGVESMIWLCNPNNPTGSVLKPHDIAWLASEKPDTLVVVDEAYIDCVPELTSVPFLKDCPNLAVVSTLSKGPGLAGAQGGYAIFGSREWSKRVRVVLGEYVTVATVAFFQAVFSHPEILRRNIAYRMKEKDRIQEKLTGLGFLFQPTATTFLLGILPETYDVISMYNRIRSQGVYLSTFHNAFPSPPGQATSIVNSMHRISPVDSDSNTRGLCVMHEVSIQKMNT